MKRKGAILAIAVSAVVFVGRILLTAPAPHAPRVTVSFLGISNALPFLGAPEEVRSPRAVFEVTNHTALRMAYHAEAHGSQPGGKGSSTTQAGDELSAYGTGTFMVATDAGTNGWRFEVVAYISRPRPAWQHRVREIAKKLGMRPIFVGPARTYPQFTNIWTTPQL
jgi:hypothetical protein